MAGMSPGRNVTTQNSRSEGCFQRLDRNLSHKLLDGHPPPPPPPPPPPTHTHTHTPHNHQIACTKVSILANNFILLAVQHGALHSLPVPVLTAHSIENSPNSHMKILGHLVDCTINNRAITVLFIPRFFPG